MVNGMTGGVFHDDKRFWPIWERAAKLDVLSTQFAAVLLRFPAVGKRNNSSRLPLKPASAAVAFV
jgi:predicted TIM-barrel fold metal-dependent hydrolase